ncbi:hypothetical protein F898_00517 [Acinetobacter courvalinii]|nr:hypothetical protein F898_00517 [Acinetobacter courvalinii]
MISINNDSNMKYFMRNPYQRKAASKSQATPANSSLKDTYRQFIQNIIMQRHVIALYHDGWALCSTPSGQHALSVWQNKSLAKLLIKDNWAQYEIQEVPLLAFIEKMIPFLKENNTILSLDLTPEGNNLLVSPDALLLDIKNFLYQIYLQRPDVFAELKLPLPRDIRLHQPASSSLE